MKRTWLGAMLLGWAALLCAPGPAPAATQAEINASIQKGIVWLVSRQQVNGSFPGVGGYNAGNTGMAVNTLIHYAKHLGKDPFSEGYVYSAQVLNGLNYIFSIATRDSVNQRVSWSNSNYNWGPAVMAITSAGQKLRVVDCPGSPVHGMTYLAVVEDALRWIEWSQNTSGGVGLWYYYPGYSSGDMSVSGWVSLGIGYATQNFDITPSATLLSRMSQGIDIAQWNVSSSDQRYGGCPYQAGGAQWINLYKSGHLLYMMYLVGDELSAPRVQRVLAYIARHWLNENSAYIYDPDPCNGDPNTGWRGGANPSTIGTVALMKAFVMWDLATIGADVDWYDDMTDVLVARQYAAGYWNNGGYPFNYPDLGTSWALLTMLKAVPTSGSIVNITYTTADFVALSADSGTGYYLVVPRGAAAPTAAQIEAGVNYGGVTVVTAGSGAVTANEEKTFGLSGLQAGTSYDLHFVVKKSGGGYTTISKSQFATVPYTAPTVTATTAADQITGGSARSGGTVADDGSDGAYPVTQRGVCWSTSPSPTTANAHTSDGTGLGGFESVLTGLAKNTRYYVRAYAVNGIGTGYGPEISFTTLDQESQTITFAELMSRVYGTAPFDLYATASSGLPVTFTSLNTNIVTISGSTVTIHGAGTVSIRASQAGNADYGPAPDVVRTLTVEKAAQAKLTLQPLDVHYYGTPRAYEPGGGTAGTYSDQLLEGSALRTGAFRYSAEGTNGVYVIRVTRSGNANYLPRSDDFPISMDYDPSWGWIDVGYNVETVRPPSPWQSFTPGDTLTVTGETSVTSTSLPFTLVVFLTSLDGTGGYPEPPNPDYRTLGEFDQDPMIWPAEPTRPFSFDVLLPFEVEPGDYRLGVYVKYGVQPGFDLVGFEVEHSTFSVIGEPPFLDLAVSSVGATVPDETRTIAAWDVVTTTVTVTNRGEVAAEYSLEMRLTPDLSGPDPSIEVLATINEFEPLPAGAGAVRQILGFVPEGLAQGSYHVGVQVINEADADGSNDWMADAQPFTVAGAAAQLSGDVRDDGSEAPVAGATVEWGGCNGVAAANGAFDLGSVAPGTNVLRVTAAGYEDYAQSLEVAAGNWQTVSVRLSPRQAPAVTNVEAMFDGMAGKITVLYNLDSRGGPAAITVQVSTDNGQSFDAVTRLEGDGAGGSVVPGVRKRIVWDVADEWPSMFLESGVVLRVVATCGGRSGQGDSNAIGLDTLPGARPVIRDIWGVFFDKDRPCLFLEGRGFRTSPEMPPFLFVPVAVDVEWNGFQPDKIEWRVGESSVKLPALPEGLRNWFVLPVSALPAGVKVEAVLHAADGTRSIPVRANFEVVEPPVFVQLADPVLTLGTEGTLGEFLELVADQFQPLEVLPKILNLFLEGDSPPSTQVLRYLADLDLDLSRLYGVAQGKTPEQVEEDPVPFEIPEDVPFIGGQEFLLPSIEASVKVLGSGTAEGELALGITAGDVKFKNRILKKLGPVAISVHPTFSYEERYSRLAADWQDGKWGAGVWIEGKADGPEAQLCPWPPIYFTSAFEAKGGGSVQVGETVSLDAGFGFEVEGAVGVGVVGIAGVEGYLGGGPTIQITTEDPVWLELLIKAGARLATFFWTHTLFETEWTWDSRDPEPEQMHFDAMVLRALAVSDPSAYRMLDRGYLTLAGKAAPRSLLPPDFGIRGIPAGEPHEFATQGYPYPTPALAGSDAGMALLWLEDDAARDPEDRTRMRFSFRAPGGAWTAAASVWDDGTADFLPSVAVAPDGFVVAAWQNLSGNLGDGAGLADALEASEIAVKTGSIAAGLDGAAQNLSANAVLDHSPIALATSSNHVLVTWVGNAGTDPLGASTNLNTIRSARWDGAQWTESVLAANVGMILRYGAVMIGSNAYLVATVDGDDDLETLEDTELYGSRLDGASWSAFTRLTDDGVADLNPRLGVSGDEPLLVWLRDGAVVSATGWPPDPSEALTVATVAYSSALADARLVSAADGRAALVWQGLADGGDWATDPVAVFHDAAMDVWGAPCRLFEAEGNERDFAGAFGTNGTLTLAYARVEPPVAEEGELPAFDGEVVTLLAADLTPGCDLALVPGSLVFSEAPAPGATVDVSVVVANVGETAVGGGTVGFFDGDPANGGFLVGEPLALPAVLGSGESVTVTQQWVIGAASIQRVLWGVADPAAALPDRDRSNNVLTQALFSAAARLESMDVLHLSMAGRRVSARVMNAGEIPWAHAARVSFRQDSSNGVELASCSLPSPLAAGASYDAAFTADFTGPGAFATVFAMLLELDGSVLDWSSVRLATGLDTDEDGLSDADELRYGTNPQDPDSDDDGLLDGEEIHEHGTLPNEPVSSGGSGLTDWEKIIAGLDPMDPDADFRILSLAADPAAVSIEWDGKAGRTYRVQRSTNLIDWVDAPDGEGDARSLRDVFWNATQVYNDPDTLDRRWFYRVKVSITEENP